MRLPTTYDGKVMGQIVEASESDDTFKTDNEKSDSVGITPKTNSSKQ